MKAYCLIRSQPVYRREAFVEGLKAAGYQVESRTPGSVGPGDVLVIWNRYADNDHHANRVEGAGGTVIVAENGYIDPGRHADRRWYALAIGGHNGQGSWPDGDPERWEKIAPQLGVELKPLREAGEHILVCPNRSFGRPGYIMPGDWDQRTVEELRRYTKRQIHVRPHPGNEPPRVPLAEDLKGCWAVVIWSSSAGVQALLSGIPVWCRAPAWIADPATLHDLSEIDGAWEIPWMRQGFEARRRDALRRLAWAQWRVEEIASGEPFRRLLPAAGQA